ncbi:MAG: AAA family ATPase [Phycisphaerae bacterium]
MQSLFEDTKAPSAGNGKQAGLFGSEIETLFTKIAERATPAATEIDESAVKAIIADETRVFRADVSGKLSDLEAVIDTRSAELAKLIEERSKPAEFVVKIGDVEREIPERAHTMFGALLRLASAKNRDGRRLNILTVGPAGCGKTYAAEQVAKALGFSYGFLSLSGGISEAHLIGRYVPTGEGGRFEYTPALFVKFYREGGVFLLDEIDAADPNVLVVVNAALANGSMRLPDGTVAERHPDFVCIGAANTYGNGADRQYVGRNQLDSATLDRFAACRLQFDYDTRLEASASNRDVCEWAQKLRDKARAAGLRRVVSTRFIFDASDLLDAGAASLEDVQRSLLLDWTDSDLAAVGEARP